MYIPVANLFTLSKKIITKEDFKNNFHARTSEL